MTEKDPDILEGEVISDMPKKQSEHKKEKMNFRAFRGVPFPNTANIQSSCLTGCLIILVIILLIATFAPALFLLPLAFWAWWYFSRRR